MRFIEKSPYITVAQAARLLELELPTGSPLRTLWEATPLEVFGQIRVLEQQQLDLAIRKSISRTLKYLDNFEYIESGLSRELKSSPKALRSLSSGSIFGFTFLLNGPFQSLGIWIRELHPIFAQGLIPLGVDGTGGTLISDFERT